MVTEEQNEGNAELPSLPSPAPRQNRQTFHLPSRLSHYRRDRGQLDLCTARGWGRRAGASERGAVTSPHTLWGNLGGIDPAAEVWKTLCQQPPPRQTDAFPERVIRAGDFSQPCSP